MTGSSDGFDAICRATDELTAAGIVIDNHKQFFAWLKAALKRVATEQRRAVERRFYAQDETVFGPVVAEMIAEARRRKDEDEEVDPQ